MELKTKKQLHVKDFYCIFGTLKLHVARLSKTCVKHPLSKGPQNGFQYQLLLNAGQKYCRMLQGEHSAILSTFIKLPFVIKTFVWSIFEWPFYTGFTEGFASGDFCCLLITLNSLGPDLLSVLIWIQTI